jgi:mono/diheme cytochrome c family protein
MTFTLAKNAGPIYFIGMRLSLIFRACFTVAFAVAGAVVTTQNAFSDTPITSKPVLVPNLSHESDHLADTAIAWDATMKSTTVPADSEKAQFVFSFTNVSGDDVIVTDVHPSCGCTTAQLPPLPWDLPQGTNSQIGVTVNLAGKYGQIVKSVTVATDHGTRELIVQITILPEVVKEPSDAERVRQMQMAKADRQAVFKGDCISCHVKSGEYKYGKALYDADCAICHEAAHRASMVPDLHGLKVTTNNDFWRTWIAHGKPGTFMPAFSTGDGGPLSDMQIASLAAYLSAAIPSKVATTQ